MTPLWGGRFTGQTDPLMAYFNASLPFDWRLWSADITGSVAWAQAIECAGLLTTDERDQIIAGLEAVRAEIAPDPAASFAGADDEDIHSYVERRLTERIGAVAGKLHTGRSRNDQVATDVRLWLKWQIVGRDPESVATPAQRAVQLPRSQSEQSSVHARGAGSPASSLDSALTELIRAAAARAEAEIDILMPGYTHVQPAQPVRWSHWLLSHAWAWQRDRERLVDLLKRVDVLPLGAGALAVRASRVQAGVFMEGECRRRCRHLP